MCLLDFFKPCRHRADAPGSRDWQLSTWATGDLQLGVKSETEGRVTNEHLSLCLTVQRLLTFADKLVWLMKGQMAELPWTGYHGSSWVLGWEGDARSKVQTLHLEVDFTVSILICDGSANCCVFILSSMNFGAIFILTDYLCVLQLNVFFLLTIPPCSHLYWFAGSPMICFHDSRTLHFKE